MNPMTQHTDIAVSSLTYALKGQQILQRYGYIAWAGRDHKRTSGCGYQLSVKGDADKAREILLSHGIKLKENRDTGGGTQ